MDLKKFVDNIMKSNVAELHSELHTLKSKISKTAINLILTYGEDNLSLIINKAKNYKIWLENDTLFVNRFYDNGKTLVENTYVFEEFNLDTQINILDEIVNSHIPPKDC